MAGKHFPGTSHVRTVNALSRDWYERAFLFNNGSLRCAWRQDSPKCVQSTPLFLQELISQEPLSRSQPDIQFYNLFNSFPCSFLISGFAKQGEHVSSCSFPHLAGQRDLLPSR